MEQLRTIYWDTWVWVTTSTDHMSWMGSTSQVTNYDWFIRETGKGVVSVRNVWYIVQELVESFIEHSGWIRERLEIVRQPLFQGSRIWMLVPTSVWVQLYTSTESWKPGLPRDGTIWLFFLSIPMIAWTMDYEHFVIMMNTFSSMLSIACHNINEHHCFPHLYKYLISTLCIHQILYVGIKSCEYTMYSRSAVKLFCR